MDRAQSHARNTINAFFLAWTLCGGTLALAAIAVQWTQSFRVGSLTVSEWDKVINCVLWSFFFLTPACLWLAWIERTWNIFKSNAAGTRILLAPIIHCLWFSYTQFDSYSLAASAVSALICHGFAAFLLWPE